MEESPHSESKTNNGVVGMLSLDRLHSFYLLFQTEDQEQPLNGKRILCDQPKIFWQQFN